MPSYEELLPENKRLKDEIQGLSELVSLLRHKQFGKSSEKVPSEQLGMFDEAETEALAPEPEDEYEYEESIKVHEHERKRGKRLKLPENLPRKEVIIDIENIRSAWTWKVSKVLIINSEYFTDMSPDYKIYFLKAFILQR